MVDLVVKASNRLSRNFILLPAHLEEQDLFPSCTAKKSESSALEKHFKPLTCGLWFPRASTRYHGWVWLVSVRMKSKMIIGGGSVC